MCRKLIYFVSFVLVLAVTGTASADQIILVPNAGFEDPVLAEDDWTWLDVPGWTQVGGEGPGVWNVTLSDFDPVIAPEGQNVLYTENAVGDAGGVAQVLTETFAANTDYTLTVEVGNSWTYYWSGYSVQLLAGGTVIAEDNDTLWPDYMLWATSTVQYTYDSADSALVGQPLEIRLLNLGLDKDVAAPSVIGVEFDNVTLSYVAPNGPIPLPIPTETIETRIAAESDDAEEKVATGDMDLASSDLEITEEGSPADNQLIGLRFNNIDVPQGSIITSAYVQFHVDETDVPGDNRPGTKFLRGEAVDDAAAFSDTAFNISSRPTTSAEASWDWPLWLTSHEEGPDQQTSDIAAVIQEIVDRPGWSSGNSLVLIITGSGENTAESFKDEPDGRPLLYVEFIPPDEIWREAESADVLGASWQVSVDPAASGARYIGSENGDGDDFDFAPGTEWVAIYNFDAVGGDYKILFRGLENDSDSFWVRIPSATSQTVEDPDQPGTGWVRFNGFDAQNTWKWDEVHSDDHGQEVAIWTLDAGAHTLEIAKREDGTYLDGFIITANLGLDQTTLPDLIDPPPTASALNPADGAEGVPIGTTLSWAPGFADATHDVYFGTSSPPAFIANQEATTYYPGRLEPGTIYYWQIDEVAPDGTINMGVVWSFTAGFSNFALDIRVATGDDDVEERLQPDRNGGLDMGSSDFEMPYEDFDPLGDLQRVAMRFVNVGIPGGMQIFESYIEFVVDASAPRDNGTELANLIIDAQLTGDAEPFVDEPFNVSNRTFTDTVVPWTAIEPWPTGGEKKRTPDISVLVQELIDQADWASGNAMVFTIQDDPCNPSEGIRATESYNGSSSLAPLLHIAGIVEVATGPSPANGAENVPITGTILSWWPGFSAVSHAGYMGTSSPPSFIGDTPEVTFDPGVLAPSTTYYWQANAVEADGTTTHAGEIWSFTTEPGEALQPDPANMAAGVALDATLSWSPGITAATHDVYFGTTSPPPLIGNQAETTFDPGPLEMETTYYWQIDEVEADGTTKYLGEIWSFKTPRPGTGTILREVWEGITGTSVSDLTDSADYPYNPTYSEEVTLFETPTDFADNFGSRVHGYLHPDTSGDYTFWIATDDNSELLLSTDENPANAVVIASEDGWAGSRDWQDGPEKSAPITLVGGQKYYISGIYKEGGGGDNLAVAWEGPDSPTRAVIAGYFLSPYAEFKATNPDPADGLIEVSKAVTLSWQAGATAASHDVYFSTDSAAVSDGTALIGNQAETSYTPAGLEKGGTYYWRVDEVEADGTTKHTGAVWSFTVTTLGR